MQFGFFDETGRKPIKIRVKREVYKRAKGKCEHCKIKLSISEGDFHHTRTPSISPTAKTVQFLCPTCHRRYGHKRKTVTHDKGYIFEEKVQVIKRKKAPVTSKKEKTRPKKKPKSKKTTIKRKNKPGSKKSKANKKTIRKKTKKTMKKPKSEKTKIKKKIKPKRKKPKAKKKPINKKTKQRKMKPKSKKKTVKRKTKKRRKN
jgi:hypothetical protein